jgi:hypothetical protein
MAKQRLAQIEQEALRARSDVATDAIADNKASSTP